MFNTQKKKKQNYHIRQNAKWMIDEILKCLNDKCVRNDQICKRFQKLDEHIAMMNQTIYQTYSFDITIKYIQEKIKQIHIIQAKS